MSSTQAIAYALRNFLAIFDEDVLVLNTVFINIESSRDVLEESFISEGAAGVVREKLVSGASTALFHERDDVAPLKESFVDKSVNFPTIQTVSSTNNTRVPRQSCR